MVCVSEGKPGLLSPFQVPDFTFSSAFNWLLAPVNIRPVPARFSYGPIITFLTTRLNSDWFNGFPLARSGVFLTLHLNGLCPGMLKSLIGRCPVTPIQSLPIPTGLGARLAVHWLLCKSIVFPSRPSSLPEPFIGC